MVLSAMVHFVLCSRDLDVLRAQRIISFIILLPTNQRGQKMRSHGEPACKMLGTNPSLPAGHYKCQVCGVIWWSQHRHERRVSDGGIDRVFWSVPSRVGGVTGSHRTPLPGSFMLFILFFLHLWYSIPRKECAGASLVNTAECYVRRRMVS